MANQPNSRSVATIDRAGAVLFLFSRMSGTLGITEISNELGISKAVVHRIVTSLVDQNLVTTDPATRRYSLGPGVLQLAASYLDQLDMRGIAREAMHRLTAETNETTTLSIRSGNSRVYVDQVTPPREVKMTVQVASSFPLHAGASSKAFLAWLPQSDIDDYIAQSDLEAVTSSTIVTESALRTELAQIRNQGFAVSLGERQEGAGSIAAPLVDHTNMPVAVISVCGPLERFSSTMHASAVHLVAATTEISRRLGAPAI